MHMADALLSPTVGATMWLAAGAALVASARRVHQGGDDGRVPLMGVLGAFVFAVQMVNFAIPGTGSSGHLGGGLLLSILLGPAAGFVVITSVLSVQALFFADGGLLALGANVFNLGVLPCFVAYPLVYRALAASGASEARVSWVSVAAAVVGLQLGALAVVAQTVFSGISSLPAGPFLALMLPIHLAIGVAEGLATAAIVLFIRRERPDLLDRADSAARGVGSTRRALSAIALAAAATGGLFSWFASAQPDGLEWSVERITGGAGVRAPQGGVHAHLSSLQGRLSILPSYDVPGKTPTKPPEATWPEANAGRSLAGLVGGLATLLLVTVAALILRQR